MRAFFAFVLTVLGLAAIALYSSAFVVHQNEQALVLRFGNPQQVITTPGLKWKVPFIDTVEKFDKRILDIDTTEQEVTASDQQRLIVDAYARYRITDQLKFYQNVRYEDRVREVVGPLIESEIRRVLGSATLQEVVKDKRESLMKQIADQVNKEGQEFGLEVVDVRIKRADLPKENLVKVYDRMRADRVREATELRAQGEAESNRVRANADKDVTIIKADATQKSDGIRGDGEAERSRIFADAFGRDPDFFRFYRSMQAYTTAIKPEDTRMLLSPDSDFFRYFRDPTGGGKPAHRPRSSSSAMSDLVAGLGVALVFEGLLWAVAPDLARRDRYANRGSRQFSHPNGCGRGRRIWRSSGLAGPGISRPRQIANLSPYARDMLRSPR